MKANLRKMGIALAIWLMLAAAAGTPAYAAAAPALTAAQQKAFDRTVSESGVKIGDQLKRKHGEYVSLVSQSMDWDRKIKEIHQRNAAEENRIRGLIRKVDEQKIARLQQAWEQAKVKHEDLFELYRTVNSQLEIARKLKDKTLSSLLQAQADALKLPVQLAREDIRAKKEAYDAAKKAASAKMKKIRGTLESIESFEMRIRAAKSAITAAGNSRKTVWSAFTKSLGKHDAKSASDLLESVNALTRQIIDRQKQIHSLESTIAGILRSAESQLTQ